MIGLKEGAMKNIKIIIIAVLAGITVFCAYKYVASVMENNSLSANIRQLNIDVQALEDEKSGLAKDLNREKEINIALNQDVAVLKDNLTQSKERMAELEADFQASQQTIENLDSEFSLVKAENTALRDQVQGLQLDISQAKVEREQMQQKLSSIAELKKAIKDLRQKTRLAKKQIQNRIKIKEKILGNDGFLVKNGKSTVPGIIKIKVEPLPGS
jgi:chromosome segregation ATPase